MNEFKITSAKAVVIKSWISKLSHMGNDKILFHIKQILHRSCSNFSELWRKLLLNSPKKLSYGITFTNLKDKTVSQR
jgi:hypothetical protein